MSGAPLADRIRRSIAGAPLPAPAELEPVKRSVNPPGIGAFPAWKKRELLRELAIGEKSNIALAKEYGISRQAVGVYKFKHKPEIAAIAADLSNQFAGLWIADKERRIAEMQGDAERVADAEDVNAAEAARTRAQLFKAVSEELGQLPGRVSVVAVPVVHVIEGASIEDLK